MRPWHLVLPAALAAFVVLTPSTGTADPYRWCAQYGGGPGGGGGRNCGFVTRQQCMDTIFGMGGFCEPNLFYTGPETIGTSSPPRQARKPKVD